MNKTVGSLSEEDLQYIKNQSLFNMDNRKVYHKKGIVMFIDVLGWKNLANENTIYNLMQLTDWLKWKILDTQLRCVKLDNYTNNVDIINLSDTIVILIDMTQGPYCWVNVFKDISEFLCKALFEYNLVFRGALSYGEYIINKNKTTFAGKGINDAAKLFESTNWANIIISDLFIKEFMVNNSLNDLLKLGIVNYNNIPYKGKKIYNERYVLYPYGQIWKEQNGFEAIKILKSLRKICNKKAKIKYSNTIKFIKEIEENKI